MSGKRNGLSPVYTPSQYSGGGGIEKHRDRTPVEVVNDGYMGVVQVTTLNAVTQTGMESLRQCDVKRQQVLAEHPNLEVPATGLLFNHARLLSEVQNSVISGDVGKKRSNLA